MRTIIINYLDMSNLGGIEKYIFNLAVFAGKNGIRFIWFHEQPLQIAESFRNVMLGDSIERIRVWSRDYHWFKHDKVEWSKGEQAIIVSFSPLGMARAMEFVVENNDIDIIPIYAVPDVTGEGYFLERFFGGKLFFKVKERLTRIFEKWEASGQVRFFALTQANALEENYEIQISDKNSKILKPIEQRPQLNMELLEQRAKVACCNIITVSRFDFPHKGYLLGLVRAFGRIHEKYENMTLSIIGYGDGENLLRQVIDELPGNIKKDIHLLGEVSPAEITPFFEKATLNVGVSGAVFDGAKNGVLTLLARNWYTEECEVYGFLNKENRHMTTASSKGDLIDEYVERIFNMDETEYKKLVMDGYDMCNADADPLYLWHTEAQSGLSLMNKSDIRFLRNLSYLTKISARIQRDQKKQ